MRRKRVKVAAALSLRKHIRVVPGSQIGSEGDSARLEASSDRAACENYCIKKEGKRFLVMD